jgi:hypothetical protein
VTEAVGAVAGNEVEGVTDEPVGAALRRPEHLTTVTGAVPSEDVADALACDRGIEGQDRGVADPQDAEVAVDPLRPQEPEHLAPIAGGRMPATVGSVGGEAHDRQDHAHPCERDDGLTPSEPISAQFPLDQGGDTETGGEREPERGQ